MKSLMVRFRSISASSRREYDRRWQDLEAAVRSESGHAWRFSSARDAGRVIEFIEWEAGQEIARAAAVAAADAALEILAPADGSGLWEEWQNGGNEG
jgi:hypothetical protein